MQPFTQTGTSTALPWAIVQILCGAGNTCHASIYSFASSNNAKPSCDSPKTLIGTVTLHMDTKTIAPSDIQPVGDYSFSTAEDNGPKVTLNP